VARELKRAGFRYATKDSSPAMTKFGNVRLYAIKNPEVWAIASTKKVVEHYESNRAMVAGSSKKPPKF
jgi:hypothetical protein